MKKVEWKNLAFLGYPNYAVSNCGTVINIKRDKVLRPCVNKGYLMVRLYNNGKMRDHRIHRLVALAFIYNPDNLPEVNHKDECKTNNCIGNLEWCTGKYNCNYGTHNERSAAARKNDPNRSKPVLQFSRDGQFLKEWPSSMEAARQLEINQGGISMCCLGKQPTSYNYIFKYKNVD